MLIKTGNDRGIYCAPSSTQEHFQQNSIQNSEQTLYATPENESQPSNVRTSLLSANYLLTLVYFTLGNLRNVTFPAWYFPWLQWSIPEGDQKEDTIGKISTNKSIVFRPQNLTNFM